MPDHLLQAKCSGLFSEKESLVLLQKVVRRLAARSLFARFVVPCLFIALLFSGCKQEPDDNLYIDDHIINEDLFGTWTDLSPTAGDSYEITNPNTGTYLSYGFSGFINYAGTIRYVANFNSAKTAGVIIIEYDADKRASYPIYDENWNPTGDSHPLKGDFIGIYYKNLKLGVSVQIAGAYAEGGAEEPDLWKAIKAFTVGNEGTYIAYGYGTYQK